MQLMSGVVIGLCGVAGLFFLRFWVETRDRLFALFALAFWMMAANRVALGAYFGPDTEVQTYAYLVRLAAFLIILYAIIDRNYVRRD